MSGIITLLTDFGTADAYVGEVKGALVSAAPSARLIDIAHDIEKFDTNGARLALARYWRRFPRGTVHLAVVDPGVGSDRAALAVASSGYFLVGPDSGLLSPALLIGGERVVRLPVPPSASNTFHGRDVFAPAAAALAVGTPLDSLGEPVHDPVVLRTPEPRRLADGSIEGEIIHIDHFGNAITNILGTTEGTVRAREHSIPVMRTYASVGLDQPLALTGSNGLVEIAVRNGSAAAMLQLSRGDKVLLTRN
jgi:S-adenosylmethionine hydrolase